MEVVRLRLSNLRYLANYTVPHFFSPGEEEVATVWDGRIEEPRRLGVKGEHNLSATFGQIKIYYAERTGSGDTADEQGEKRPSGYMEYIENQNNETAPFSFYLLLYVREKYIWDFYLDKFCNIKQDQEIILYVQMEGLSIGGEPDGSGLEWEDHSERLLIKGFTFEHAT